MKTLREKEKLPLFFQFFLSCQSNFSKILPHLKLLSVNSFNFRQSKIFNLIQFNPLPNDKLLDWSKFKAISDKKINVALKQQLCLGWVENIVEKGENAGYQHFLLFPQCFQRPLFQGH